MLITLHKTAYPPPLERNLWLVGRNLCLGLLCFWLATLPAHSQTIAFDLKSIDFNGNGSISSGTSLEFGPDNRLYVSEVDGDIKVFTIQRNEGTGAYQVTASETITLVKSIPNHNDDGTLNTGVSSREVTGLTVVGTAANPVIYVTSSDSRIGAGGGGGDTNLDTNSGIITRLTWNGSAWVAVDLVRGLPRSEENHATNGLEFVTVNGTKYLIVCSGGLTNAGAPSNNFAYITEYALSAAVLSVNLTMLESMPILTDAASGRSYVYDLPTLDDPTRANANGITDPNTAGYNGVDVNDPWGGNDGLNMAKLVVGSPVQMFSPGYRNTYDLVVTESGGVYVTDNGANGGWGGYPEYEANATQVSNIFRVGEPGSTGADSGPNNSPFDPQVNNDDHLNLVTTNIQNYTFGSVYGGHPCPVRANPNAGLYTRGIHSDASADYFTATTFTDDAFRTQLYDPDGSTLNSSTDPESALPANWPPVDAALLFAPNADFRQPDLSGNANPDGDEDIIIATWQNNTNGIDEYTASNFGGQMQGNLIAGKSGGSLHRVILGNNGTTATVEQNKFSTSGGNPLGITCQGDADIFPGTIWVATFDSRIVVLEPNDFVTCINPNEPGYSPTADNDNDGFTNQDELDNNTDICNGGNFPSDNDGDNVSDLNDTDDDNDGTLDANDPFQLYHYNQNANALAEATLPINNQLFSQQLDANGEEVGYLGLGLTGLMNNGAANPNYQNWLDDPAASTTDTDDIYGGAIGAVTIYHTTGDALGNQNDQEKAFQMAAKVGTSTGMFEVSAAMFPPFHNWSPTESQGLFIGTGDQDNYIKLVLTSNGSGKIVQVVSENSGTVTVGASSPITIPANVNTIELYFMVNPANGSIQPQFSIDGVAKTNVGSPFNASGSVLNAIQNDNTLLAVGIIGTADSDDNFASNWDFINVEGNAPFITNALPDVEAFVNDPAQNINLDNFFDDNGTLTYTVQSNSNNAVGANITGNTLTLNFPGSPATSNITVRASDIDNLFVEQTFTVTVSDEPQVLFRINAGDNTPYTDPQGNLWSADQYSVSGNPYPSSQNPVGTAIANTDKDFIYQTERSGSGGWQYQIPISQPGTYRINLHFAEIFFGLPGGGSAGGVGSRVFDIIVEGQTLLDNYDIIADVGTATAVVKTFDVTVNDGTLNIVGTASVNQPKISAIEVFSLSANPPTEIPINVTSISNQTNLEGTAINLQVAATGGDGALSYAATGLPAGLSISNTTGLISGTISTGAANNSPYAVTVTVNDADGNNADAQTVNFQWTVTAPVVIVPGQVVYRVNAGGPTITAIDGSINWSADQSGSPSPYLANAGSNNLNGFTVNPGPTIDASKVPASVFSTERWDSPNDAAGEMKWEFPISTSGNFVVNLYMGNGFSGTSAPGQRIFDIKIENQEVLSNIDLSAEFGHEVGGLKTYTANVTDGSLTIEFIHQTENPLINAIEIIAAADEATLTGSFTLQGRTDYTENLTVNLYAANATLGDAPLYQFTPTSNAGGNFEVSGITPGTYQIAIKSANYLQVIENVTLNAGNNTASFGELKAGDANGDNAVGLEDFSILSTSFNLTNGNQGFDVRADFNGDGSVTLEDFSILSTNFNLIGEALNP